MSEELFVDLITHDPKQNEFVLYLLEDGPWPTIDSDWNPVLKRIQDRVFLAADVAIDGKLAAEFPESVGLAARVQIDSPSGCPERLAEVVAAVDRFLKDDPQYSQAIRDSRFIVGLRVVTGHGVGRFNENRLH